MSKLTFIGIYRQTLGVDDGFYGEVKILIEAIDFVEACKTGQELEKKMEGIQFTLASLEFEP